MKKEAKEKMSSIKKEQLEVEINMWRETEKEIKTEIGG